MKLVQLYSEADCPVIAIENEATAIEEMFNGRLELDTEEKFEDKDYGNRWSLVKKVFLIHDNWTI